MPEYTLEQLYPPPASHTVSAWAVNDDGDACGHALFPSGSPQGWYATLSILWGESGITVLDTSGIDSMAWDVNSAESVVGPSPLAYPLHAFLYQNQWVTVANKNVRGLWKDMPIFVNDLSTITWA